MTGEEKKQRADAVSGQRDSIIGVEVEVEVNLKLRVPRPRYGTNVVARRDQRARG